MVTERDQTNQISIQNRAQKCDIVVSSATTVRRKNCKEHTQSLLKAALSYAHVPLSCARCPVLPEFEKPVWSEVRLKFYTDAKTPTSQHTIRMHLSPALICNLKKLGRFPRYCDQAICFRLRFAHFGPFCIVAVKPVMQ
jgi:hypothetical protein